MHQSFVSTTTHRGKTLFHGNCLDVLPLLKQQGVKVNMILTDPPYGTTQCKWDTVIDLTEMWRCIEPVVYDNTPILLFSQQPFTSILGHSNIKNLRYNWIWEKTHATGFLNANRMPMKCHEEILVFYKKLPYYQPVKTSGHKRKVIKASHREICYREDIYADYSNFSDYDSTERYPRSVIRFKSDKQKSSLHPTQKPVELLEYFIKTYTREGDVVLDFAMGSGSTGEACENTGRKFIGIEIMEKIYNTAYDRLII
ncbi:site-specific DNA-methyltransferase [Dysgonomonas sp. ZJ709]|uniref:DNA-methyltransferase n=1 Tax=Dysgonomonas sp. ZJ709 TaxID=2709797 RepID=UPI0013E9AA26|nr:site-specific DNA-methyltransferase [Dysgonomonas sp. ZJ709]